MCPPDAPAFWEAGYAAPGVSTMGGPNHDIVELSRALPPRARVLDLGCGEGRNAFFLAGLGHDVTAIDISTAGIAKLAGLAESSGLRNSDRGWKPQRVQHQRRVGPGHGARRHRLPRQRRMA